MIHLTEKASEKVKELMASEKKEGYGLRVYVEGGGCSGFQYGMAFEENSSDEDDVLEMFGVKIMIDPYSAPMLNGTEIDYNDSLQGAGFDIKNPNAKSTCGCGQSFS
ncbi:MAG: iron-sulfur cluster insertion protein ErpA [Nitrospira sp.]|nr:iron-sulfur cluster insertion protein ErpA [Candidatus Manganitrophaceae bacterium]HIL35171.1 iron-sulfur cluster insertion protein ErpA [Candidatus Manganitrophaceae bacterium]